METIFILANMSSMDAAGTIVVGVLCVCILVGFLGFIFFGSGGWAKLVELLKSIFTSSKNLAEIAKAEAEKARIELEREKTQLQILQLEEAKRDIHTIEDWDGKTIKRSDRAYNPKYRNQGEEK